MAGNHHEYKCEVRVNNTWAPLTNKKQEVWMTKTEVKSLFTSWRDVFPEASEARINIRAVSDAEIIQTEKR